MKMTGLTLLNTQVAVSLFPVTVPLYELSIPSVVFLPTTSANPLSG